MSDEEKTMNLPHALATLTRDVLQNWRPVWYTELSRGVIRGRYCVEGEPLYGLDWCPTERKLKNSAMKRSLPRFEHQACGCAVCRVSPRYHEPLARYMLKQLHTVDLYTLSPEEYERIWGPLRGGSLYVGDNGCTTWHPDTGPVRCVGEDGSIVYARVHFEHPPLMVKGRLKD